MSSLRVMLTITSKPPRAASPVKARAKLLLMVVNMIRANMMIANQAAFADGTSLTQTAVGQVADGGDD